MRYSYEYKRMCVELYQQGKWPEIPTGISEHSFRVTIQKWARIEKACGSEALRHKNQNKVWTAEEKYELAAKVLAGASNRETAFTAGISDGLLYSWVRCYKMKGYQGLDARRKGRSPKEPAMKKQIVPAELPPSEREEMIRLRAENERLRAEIAAVKKEIALREERCAAQLKAKKLRSSQNSANMNTNEIVSYNLSTSPNMEQIKDMPNKAFKRFPSTQGLIISTITITAGSKRKQNGCLPLNSGKHPGWKLNYSILNRCPENRVHIKPLTLPISENILIDEHEPVYTFHGRRSIIALTIRLHFLDG